MELRETHPKKPFSHVLVWVFFCAVCVQLALSQWFFIVISGEKTNLYFGILASMTLLAAMLTVRLGDARASSTEVAVSLILLGLAMASGLHSSIAISSSSRAFVLMATGLGGFWCARILLDTPSRQKAFVWLCTAILIALIGLSLLGQMLLGTPNALISALYKNAHPLVHMLLLLVFAPLALIGSKRIPQVLLGLVLLVLMAMVLYSCATAGNIASAVLLAPLVVMVVVFTTRGSRTAGLAIVLLMLFVATGAHFVKYSAAESFTDPKYQVYRVESYPFSWHVAKNNPLLGVGLRAPRQDQLENYEVRHPELTKKVFHDQLVALVTPENTFLALLAGCGIPFTVIYLAVIFVFLFRLVRSVERPPSGLYLDPLVLLVAVTGSLFHSFTTDTMLHAQLCWFFHILLGLIPKPAKEQLEHGKSLFKSLTYRSVGTVGAVVLGIIIGTHPGLAPDKLELSAYLKNIPILSAFYDFGGKKEARLSPAPKASKPLPTLPGALLVKLHDFDAGWEPWQVMFFLDNSKTMASRTASWQASRLDVARDLVERISAALPPDSWIAVRSFTDEISLKMGSQEIPLTVSHRIFGWAQAPFIGLEESLMLARPQQRIDLCAVAASYAQKDFDTNENLKQRIILLTDGTSGCAPPTVPGTVKRRKKKTTGYVDVIALGMEPTSKEAFSQLSEDTHGTFLDVALPAQVQKRLTQYASILRVSRPVKFEISGGRGVRRGVVGEEVKLPPGSYSLWLPEDLRLPQSEQKVENIEVSADKLTIVTLSRQDGRLTVGSTSR
jgi:O-antigen ligase